MATLKEAYRKAGDTTREFTDRTSHNSFTLKEGRLRLYIWKKFFTQWV